MYIYLSEIILKIIASGFILIKYSYLRFIRNWLDLILITLYILHIMNPESIIDFSPLRLITLLINLGHMIKGLQIMLNALGRSFKFISEALIVVALFTVFFALIGTSLFQGLINYRCIPIDGSETPTWIFCNGNKCPEQMICQEQMKTPNIPTSFNSIFFSFAQVLRTVTMDDWSYVMFFTLKTYSTLVWVYYIFVILIGGFFGFNLVIAVLKTLYSESVLRGEVVKIVDVINLQNLKQTGQYELLQQFKTYISGDLMLTYHNNIQTNGSNGPRILSGKKRVLIPRIFFHNLQNCNLKHLLLPKFRNLTNYRYRMNHSNYEQYDELYIKCLYFDEFTKFQPVPVYNIYYSNSEEDVLLQQIQDHKKESYAKIKFRMIYHVKQAIKQSVNNSFKWPQKQGRQLISIESVNLDENEKSILFFERQLNSRSLTYAAHKKSTIISLKHLRSMPFSTKREGEMYINVQGIFLNYKGLCEKIHLKIPKKLSEIPDYEAEYFQIKHNEQITKRISYHNISVKNILRKYDGYEQLKQQLNVRDTLIWLKGTSGYILIIRKYLYILLNHQLSQIIIDLIIFINFLLLSLLGIISNNLISSFEDFTTICLVAEFCLRLLAYSPTKFIKNSYFLVETIIIVVNFIELTLSPFLNLDELQLRLMRATKSLLFYRCLKYNKMAVIIGCIAQKTLKQYIYLTLLMFFAILTYGLMGMEMYAGKFDQQDPVGQLHSFDDPIKSWMTIFNIMTNDDWYGVLVLGSQINVVFSLIYSLSMVFFLNYITYGLVMAILLDGFGQYLGESETVTLDQIEEDKSNASKKQNQQFSFSDSEVDDDDGTKSLRKIKESKSINSDSNSKESTYYYILQQIEKAVKENKIQKAKIFNGILCQESLFIFNKQNKFRIFCCLLYRKSIFKHIDQILIIGSVTIFALQTYQLNQDLLEQLLLLINLLIIIHKLIQIIALGFCFDKGAYVKHFLQIFDMIYLLIFILKIFDLKAQIIDILLYLRFLRPLDLLHSNQWIKITYQILTVSIKNMLEVLFTMVIIWTMFAVYGMILYQNQFGYCVDKMNFNISQVQCLEEGRYWTTFQHNFDNITTALPTLFVISTFDGWGEIFQVAENSQPSDYGPKPFVNQYPAYIFLVAFCFIGSMFFLSLFTGLLFLNYKAQEQKIQFNNLTQAQQEFMSISQKIFHDKVAFSNPPKNYIRKISQYLINNKLFLKFSFFVMVVDTIIQLSFYSEMDLNIALSLNKVYQVVSYLFTAFVIIEVTSYGFHRYFDDSWRQFYLFVLVISIIDLILDYQNNWFTKSFKSNVYTEYFQFYRVLFALRNFRMLILIQGFQGLQRLVRVMGFAFPFLAKLLFILVITTISFALIGQQLYGHIDKGSIIDDQINFKTFTSSLLTLLKCASCDNFRSVMTDTMIHNPYCREDPKYCGSQYSQIYFILFVFISNYVLINLFVLGLIEQFEKFFQMQNSMIQVYIEKIDQIKTTWCQYSYQKQGKAMHYKFIGKFLMDLGEPFIGKDDNLWDSAKLSGYFKIKADEYGYIKFNHLIYELFRRTFKNEVFKKGPEEAIKIVKAFNKEMQLRLYYSRKDYTLRRNQIATFIELNPNYSILHDYLSVLIIFKAWQAYSQTLLQESKNLENFTDRSSMQNKNDEWDIFSQEDEEESSLSNREFTLRNQKIQSERNEFSRDEIALPIYEEEHRNMQLGLIPVQGGSDSELSIVSSMDGYPNRVKGI